METENKKPLGYAIIIEETGELATLNNLERYLRSKEESKYLGPYPGGKRVYQTKGHASCGMLQLEGYSKFCKIVPLFA